MAVEVAGRSPAQSRRHGKDSQDDHRSRTRTGLRRFQDRERRCRQDQITGEDGDLVSVRWEVGDGLANGETRIVHGNLVAQSRITHRDPHAGEARNGPVETKGHLQGGAREARRR